MALLFGRGIILFVLVIAVVASVAQKVLHIPILEIGELLLDTVYKLHKQFEGLLQPIVDVHSYTFCLAIPVICVLCYYGYKLLFTRMNRIRILGEVGYLPDGKFSLKEIATIVAKRRMVGDIPPHYPNGWFGVMESFMLKQGEPKTTSIIGQQLALFRDDKGEVHVLDAYCPHMGANLAAGGRVKGDCIECPFHGWKFRGSDGKCVSIPYSDTVPSVAKVKSWPSREVNGWVYIWYHAEGLDPTWQIPEIEEITNGTLTYGGRTEHYINAHIEEIPENGADVAHLKQVHAPVIAAGVDLTTMWTKYLSFACHNWTAEWKQNPAPEEHIGSLKLTHDLTFFGISLPPVFISMVAEQIGPATVYLRFEGFFGKGVYVHQLTPVEPMVQKLVHNIYMHWTVPNIVRKFFMLGEAIQVERDVMIWNNKRYQGKPVFCKSAEDSLVARHRRWYSQFYTEHSPRLSFRKEGLDW